MIMKKVKLLLVLVLAAITVSAQDSGFSNKPGRSATFAQNSFWSNWYIGAGAGANLYLGSGNSDAKFANRLTVAPTVQIGKWASPSWGGRLVVSGGAQHTFDNNASIMNHAKYMSVEADLMWNMFNYLGKYNEKRFYSLIPYVGIGGQYDWDYTYSPNGSLRDQKSFSVVGGLANNFRLSNRLALSLDFSIRSLHAMMDKNGDGTFTDARLNGSASLIYKVGRTDFSEALLMDQPLLDDLNSQINKLRQENARLAANQKSGNDCPPAPKCPECPQVSKSTFVSNVVFFRLNSANIDANQDISIYNTAKYLQDNPNAKVKIVGYADKKTGTAPYNLKLSEKRAKNVANALINKYNINSNRVTIEWKGDTVQPYAENAWNRVAIFFAE